jgi:RNA polymerase-binding transcription factor
MAKKTEVKKSTTGKAKASSTKKEATSKSIKAKKATAKSTAVKSTTDKKTVATQKASNKSVTKKASPNKKVKGYPKKDLEIFRKVIIDKKTEIIEQLQNLKDQMMDSSTGQYVNENSPYSLHMAEQGTDAQEREKLYLWAQRESKFLGYLEEALKRIELGTYGICIECMEEPKNLCPTCPLIPKPRLLAVPHTQHCVEIKNAASKNR